MLCQVDERDLCKEEKMINSQGQMKIDASNVREVRVRIGNFIDTKTLDNNKAKDNKEILNSTLPENINKVKITLIYHGTRNMHCDQRRMNKVYSENMKTGSCIQYHIPIPADFEIMLSRSDVGEAPKNLFFICNQLLKPSEINGRFHVKGEQIKEICKENTHQMLMQMLVGTQQQANDTKVVELKMEYLVSYNNDTITLADGVAYTTIGLSTP